MTGAVVLAAGPGTRLGALGVRTAKTMITVSGRPFLEHLAGRLLGAGVYPVVVAVNHHEDAILDHFAKHPFAAGLRFVHTDQRGTGADLLQCLDSFGDEGFVVWNGDTVVDIDLAAFLHQVGRSDRAVISLSRRPDLPNRDAWFVGADGGVLATLEAEPGPAPPEMYAWRGSSTGVVHLTARRLRPFRGSDSCAAPDLYAGILPALAARGELAAHDNGCRYVVDFGTRSGLAGLDQDAVAGWIPEPRRGDPR